MDIVVRPAAQEDCCVPLLYASAQPYYDAYAGGETRALGLLRAVYPRRRHAASYELCRVAVADGEVVGVLAGFPVLEAERLSRRFVALTLPRLPPWLWPRTLRHLRAAGTLAPRPPGTAFYVDALAVQPDWRRRGVARRLLADAEAQARRAGLRGVALDTGLANAPARALYRAYGFSERDERRAADERTARAVGGPGFVSYFKPA
jgi:ribosomal protein S18 acetylase RimI-like enzyme